MIINQQNHPKPKSVIFARRTKRTLISAIIKAGLTLNSGALIAIAIRLSASRLPGMSAGKRKRRHSILILEKTGGLDDVLAAFNHLQSSITFFTLNRNLIKTFCDHYLKNEVTDLDYFVDKEALKQAKEQYYKLMLSAVYWLRIVFDFGAIIQFSILFYAEREFIKAAHDGGIKAITIHKECLWSKPLVPYLSRMYQHSCPKYYGTALCVYNERVASAFIDLGICRPEQITIIGCPRLDFSFQLRHRKRAGSQGNLLYYLIDENAGLPEVVGADGTYAYRGVKVDNKVLNWSNMVRKVNREVIKFAEKNPQITVVCKGKVGFGQEQILNFFKNFDSTKATPENITFIEQGVGHKLLGEADAVIAFNTTALFESIAAGIPTIVPHIFDKDEMQIANYAHETNEEMLVVDSCNSFQRALENQLKANDTDPAPLSTEVKNSLHEWLGNSDGQSGKRLRLLITEILGGKV